MQESKYPTPALPMTITGESLTFPTFPPLLALSIQVFRCRAIGDTGTWGLHKSCEGMLRGGTKGGEREQWRCLGSHHRKSRAVVTRTGHLWAGCRSECDHREYQTLLASKLVVWEQWVFRDGSLGMPQPKVLAAGGARRSRPSDHGTWVSLRAPCVCIWEMILHQHLDLDLAVTSGLIWPVVSSWGDWDPSVTSTQLTTVFEPCATATLNMCVFIDIPTRVCVCAMCTWMFLCACSLLSIMLCLTARWTWGHEDATDSPPLDHQTDNS